jgi:hypothetical protein
MALEFGGSPLCCAPLYDPLIYDLLISSSPPIRPMRLFAPMEITKRMTSSAYICGMLKML